MAAWQFSMHLVPRGTLLAVCPDLRSVVAGEQFDAIEWWSGRQPVHDWAARLSAVLEEVATWGHDARQWGQSDGSTVRVSHEAGTVESMHARVDLRVADRGVIDALAALAVASDAYWVGGDANARVPVGQTREALLVAIGTSDAASFVADPNGYLDRLGRKVPSGKS